MRRALDCGDSLIALATQTSPVSDTAPKPCNWSDNPVSPCNPNSEVHAEITPRSRLCSQAQGARRRGFVRPFLFACQDDQIRVVSLWRAPLKGPFSGCALLPRPVPISGRVFLPFVGATRRSVVLTGTIRRRSRSFVWRANLPPCYGAPLLPRCDRPSQDAQAGLFLPLIADPLIATHGCRTGSALADNVHRSVRLGAPVLISELWY